MVKILKLFFTFLLKNNGNGRNLFSAESQNCEVLSSIQHIFPQIFSYFYLCGSGSVFQIRIRIHKVNEYGFNLDPDQQRLVQYYYCSCRLLYSYGYSS